MKTILLVFLAAFLGSPAVHAASFDCAKARSRVEKLICTSDKLGDLDQQLDGAFSAAKQVLAATEAKSFTQEQIRWLQAVRNACTDTACLVRVYQERLNAVDPFADHRLSCDEMRHKPALVFRPGIDLGSGSGSPTEVDFGCPESLGALPFMKELLRLAELVRSDGGPQRCVGTIVYAQQRYYQFDLTQAGLAPRTLPNWAARKGPADWTTYVQQDDSRTSRYFRQWSEQSLGNQALYAQFAQAFDGAAAQLTSRYMQQFAMSAEEAQSATLVALSGVVRRAAGSAPEASLRDEFPLLQQLRAGPLNKAQVDAALPGLSGDQRLTALKLALVQNQPHAVVAALADALGPARLRAVEAAAAPDLPGDQPDPESVPEPLLSLALGSLDNLDYLLRRQVPVEAANGFGKTPLFYAIGAGKHAAVELLLQHRADVGHAYKSKQELRPGGDVDACVFAGLNHTARTPLMHAAQNSDVRMLKILLKAGAALRARDDMGFNAHDYALMGKNTDNARYLASLGLEPAAPR